MMPLSLHRYRTRGVALVVTLILLSAILVITLAVLSISRTERSSVTTSQQLMEAEYMATAGAERAKAFVASQILAATNMAAGGYARPFFWPELGPSGTPADVALAHVTGNLIVSRSGNTWDPTPFKTDRDFLTNLFYDARVPVFVTLTNGREDFRHYLDLNRNGMFESNGFYRLLDQGGQPLGTNFYFHAGDPEWVGVLQNPKMPHSPSNRFVGRYAYLVAPAGRTLDINAIHNDVLRSQPGPMPFPPTSAIFDYRRHQGVGTYEANLAAFFADINTNVWGRPGSYTLDPTTFIPQGSSFAAAYFVLRHRYNGAIGNLPDLADWLTPARFPLARGYFELDGADTFANDTPSQIITRINRGFLPTEDQDDDETVIANRQLRWPGVDNPRRYRSIDDFFSRTDQGGFMNLKPTPTVDSLREVGSRPDTYNRYTFYRLLSEMGTDTGRRNTNLIHLNFQTPPSKPPEDFVRWTNTSDLFLRTAHKLFETYLQPGHTNDLLSQNFAYLHTNIGPVRFAMPLQIRNISRSGLGFLSPTNIPLYPRNLYNPAVHRYLQLAANIAEPSATNNAAPFSVDRHGRPHAATHYPTIYVPMLGRNRDGDVAITNYVEDLYGAIVTSRLGWKSLGELVQLPPQQWNLWNVYGVPPIVAARKGFPSLNEIAFQTQLKIQRKLRITKQNLSDNIMPGSGNPASRVEEQFKILYMTNALGIELLNGYTNLYPRELACFLQVRTITALVESNANPALPPVNVLPSNVPGFNSSNYFSTNMVFQANTWTGGLFNVYAKEGGGQFTNLSSLRIVHQSTNKVLDDAVYLGGGQMLSKSSNSFRLIQPNQPSRRMVFRATNEVSLVIIDRGAGSLGGPLGAGYGEGRVVNVVSLSRLDAAMDLDRLLKGSDASSEVQGTSPDADDFDDRLSNSTLYNGLTLGQLNQIEKSRGNPPVGEEEWANFGPGNAQSKQSEIDAFTAFLRGGPSAVSTNLHIWKDTPFTPGKAVLQTWSWQANDPLLHHIPEQMLQRLPGSPADLRFQANGVTDSGGVMLTGSNIVTSFEYRRNTTPPAWNIGRLNTAHWRWGASANNSVIPPSGVQAKYYEGVKDPLVMSPDDWDFPTNGYPTLGALGRVHRATPWQTIYLKSEVATNSAWIDHAGVDVGRLWADDFFPTQLVQRQALYSHPTNDWRLVDLFSASISDNANAGSIGVNQDGLAAWSAILSGVTVLSDEVNKNQAVRFRNQYDTLQTRANNLYRNQFSITRAPDFLAAPLAVVRLIEPVMDNSTAPLAAIVNGINRVRNNSRRGLFETAGQLLSVPELTMQSPFLQRTDLDPDESSAIVNEEMRERIPRQILSLVRSDANQPRFVIYAYGQALQPAPDSLVKDPTSPFFGLCQNYQVVAEAASKMVLRMENVFPNTNQVFSSRRQIHLKPVVESFEFLPQADF